MQTHILTAAMILAGAVPAYATTALVISPTSQLIADGSYATTQAGATEERFNTSADPTTCSQPNNLGVDLVGGFQDTYDLVNDNVVNRRRAPAGDASCYLTLGSARMSDTLEIDFGATSTTPLTYFGVYWGSIDEYNHISFFSGGTPIDFTGGLGSDLTGDTVAGLMGIAMYTSNWIEFQIDPADHIDHVVLSTTNYAFELDNIAYKLAAPVVPHVAAVAEPGALASLAFGLALAMGIRTRSPAIAGRVRERRD